MKKKFFTKFLMVIAMLFGLVVTGGNFNEVHAATAVTVITKISDYATDNGWANSKQYLTVNMDSNITATVTGGSETGKYYTSGNNWRIYMSDSGKVTINALNECTLTSVKFTYSASNSGTLVYNGTNIASGTVVNAAANATSITLSAGRTGGTKQGQARITAIEVNYIKPESSHVCEFNQKNILAKFMASPATCTEPATYYYSCSCGEKTETETFVYGEALGHEYDEYDFCTRCEDFNPESSYAKSVAVLFNKYYNDGVYTKETVLNVSPETDKEVGVYFHAGKTVAHRKTVYEVGSLSMVTSEDGISYDNDTLSKYEDENGFVSHTGLGGDWSVNWPSVEEKFVTLYDFKNSTLSNWTYENGEYVYYLSATTCDENGKITEDAMTTMAREFVAPMWLAPNIDNYNYVEFVKLTVKEEKNVLIMKLYVDEQGRGQLVEDSNLVFAKAEIVKGSENLSTLATFDFGDMGVENSWYDGSELKEDTSYESGKYTLTLTNMSKVYGSARDLKGNSCLKLGGGSAAASLTFAVPADVNKVIIYVAGYKATAVTVDVNGAKYDIATLANNGEYTPIEIDTSSQKTINFKTTSNGYRCMINSIEFH